MFNSPLRRLLLSASLATALYASPDAAQAQSLADLYEDGKVFGELRYRYENVEQDGLARTATANTLRASLGFETGTYMNFKALAEVQAVRQIGDDSFNDTTNGKGTYPVIADPENSEFNQAYVAWTGIPTLTLKAGRQIINLGNQRFVGSVGWRQNDQTFDALSAIFKPNEKTSVTYSYAWNANRIFGEHHAMPDYSGQNHFIYAEHTCKDWLKVAAYGYFLDIDEARTLSSRTLGAQLSGKKPLTEGFAFHYLAEYAEQDDYRRNPNAYDASYYHLVPGVSWKDISIHAGFESLEGNGTVAFQTPFATLHAFNGWADKFLTTPANGLEDAYLRVSYKAADIHPWIDGISADAVYHDYGAENTSADYGSEWNFQLAKTFKTEGFVTKDLSVTAKYADYNADDLLADTEKVWLMVGVKF